MGSLGQSIRRSIRNSLLVPTLACSLSVVMPAADQEQVLERLQSYEPGTREAAALVAGREGMTEAIPLLVVGLRDKNARGIKTAGEALAWMGPAAAPTIIELLADKDPFVRAEVLYGLQFFDGSSEERQQFVPAVQPLLRDSNRYVRRNALKYLATLGPDAAPVVADLQWLLSDAVNRDYAAGVLGLIGAPAWSVIQDALQSDDVAIRKAGLLAVGRMPQATADAVAGVIPLLQDAAVQVNALQALQAVGAAAPQETIAALQALLPTIGTDTNRTQAAAMACCGSPKTLIGLLMQI